MTVTLRLYRGLPGSGKSTAADGALLPKSRRSIAADDFFMRKGKYEFDPSKIAEAHAECQERCKMLLSHGGEDVSVANTFTQRWELQPYLEMAECLGVRVVVLDLFDGGLSDEELAERNTHGVPVEAIAGMRARYEHCWRTGNPLPPWMR